jgi:hypothetical protein
VRGYFTTTIPCQLQLADEYSSVTMQLWELPIIPPQLMVSVDVFASHAPVQPERGVPIVPSPSYIVPSMNEPSPAMGIEVVVFSAVPPLAGIDWSWMVHPVWTMH